MALIAGLVSVLAAAVAALTPLGPWTPVVAILLYLTAPFEILALMAKGDGINPIGLALLLSLPTAVGYYSILIAASAFGQGRWRRGVAFLSPWLLLVALFLTAFFGAAASFGAR
jgi:hypothetical protein